MLIPSLRGSGNGWASSLSRRVNANSQQRERKAIAYVKLIKKGEC
ncbi:hypothetical protein MCC10106_1503 [Bifidobacterium longum subsp. longum]|nr:hypothetical protein MCC10007_1506 [Bifidobacterium longum subsp. longum]TCE23140.1 hypothetical protein MCC10033_1535 [Bifidobacterium longum subsp. longum]TCE34516.1 hypothetical protein MCC10041_1966 [Bifidobacterium longum subsp. longum]TCF14212.1 hypothetical protein MCC10086_1388 [Bifidobacterium longum subsp. longum]TCF18545.1 hypothetical protein MCC10091_1999 [Bifidobacterium longum subsp. longum]